MVSSAKEQRDGGKIGWGSRAWQFSAAINSRRSLQWVLNTASTSCSTQRIPTAGAVQFLAEACSALKMVRSAGPCRTDLPVPRPGTARYYWFGRYHRVTGQQADDAARRVREGVPRALSNTASELMLAERAADPNRSLVRTALRAQTPKPEAFPGPDSRSQKTESVGDWVPSLLAYRLFSIRRG